MLSMCKALVSFKEIYTSKKYYCTKNPLFQIEHTNIKLNLKIKTKHWIRHEHKHDKVNDKIQKPKVEMDE